jgi:hypothetical protein
LRMGSGKVKRIRTLAMQFSEPGRPDLQTGYSVWPNRPPMCKEQVCAQFHLAHCRRVG